MAMTCKMSTPIRSSSASSSSASSLIPNNYHLNLNLDDFTPNEPNRKRMSTNLMESSPIKDSQQWRRMSRTNKSLRQQEEFENEFEENQISQFQQNLLLSMTPRYVVKCDDEEKEEQNLLLNAPKKSQFTLSRFDFQSCCRKLNFDLEVE
jgi:hypothetical protein